jgi:hypothetical protein
MPSGLQVEDAELDGILSLAIRCSWCKLLDSMHFGNGIGYDKIRAVKRGYRRLIPARRNWTPIILESIAKPWASAPRLIKSAGTR